MLFLRVIPESAKSSTKRTLDPILGVVLARSLEKVTAPRLIFYTITFIRLN